MPKLLKILDQLEDALPDMRAALEGSEDYMAEGDEEGEELPPMDEEPMEGEDAMPMDEAPDDLSAMPPLPMGKKKKLPFPPA